MRTDVGKRIKEVMPRHWREVNSSACSRLRVSRSTVQTLARRHSVCGTAFLLYVLLAGVRAGLLHMSSLGQWCFWPHRMAEFLEQKLPLQLLMLLCLPHDVSHLWAPGLGFHMFCTYRFRSQASSAAARDSWSLQSSLWQSSLTGFWFCTSRCIWLLSSSRPYRVRVLYTESLLQRDQVMRWHIIVQICFLSAAK